LISLAEIALSANEINALIAHYEPWAALRDKVYASIEGDKIAAQVSLPIAMRLFEGKFFNGDISMTFTTEKGLPKPSVITVRSGSVELPNWALRYITSKEFVESLGVPSISEPDTIGANLTALEIKDNQLIVRAKKK
jgi:hypothetical protein